MRISSGLAEINMYNAGKLRKAYVWPSYNQKSITPIKKVTRQLPGNQIYTKPTDSERTRLLDSLSSNFTTYGEKTGPTTERGLFFDAMC